ncbi:hypothetical protein FOMPIDRAFT_1038980 [Fomitopsis schrenkii]|uniref:Uncharacterized protein n=1 Tax=Fomitopsis schrenkii TaxID=2126942 RepID=S8DJS6_FOMSC|nr:hypothetical protein FOMPIDRAFT_1038980 [Fomitopsis schrenkii]
MAKKAQVADTHHSRPSQSGIPVFTPRKSQSTVPSTFSTPHLGLVPPTRHLSVSGSPTHPSPSSSASSTNGGITPFRSFRNLFSTASGSSKNQPSTPSPAPLSSPKSSFPAAALGTLRRSIGGDRFATSPSPSPAIAPTDLSTIIEADTSGLSRHLPPLDSSQEIDTSPSDDDPDLEHDTLNPKLLHASSRNNMARSPPSKESSVLDFSTSKVTSEILQAMGGAGPDRTQGWLNGVIVDDHDPEPERDLLAESGNTGDGDTSFNLSELDPDLAALLSPNRLVGANAERPSADGLPAPHSPIRPTVPTFDSSRRPAFSRTPPGSSPPRHAESLRMPKSRTAPNLPSTISHSRLNRSVSDRPAIQREHSASPHSASPPLGVPSTSRALSHSPERPSTAHEGLQRDRLDQFASRRPHTGTGESSASAPRRAAISRLLSPAQLGPHVATPRAKPRTSPTPSPAFSRPSSSAGASFSRLQSLARSSLDVRPSLDDSTRVTPFRHRKRSLSVVEAGQSVVPGRAHARPAAEWLGPQTAKAFAAAGLLDQSYARDRDSTSVGRRTPSRFGTTRSSTTEDSRSRYMPSRMAFSEAGSVGSWTRGETPSVSRRGSIVRTPALTATVSELGGPETPRTTFSAASTAPTSVSASSSAHLQSELQALQERHQVETGALLSALADSQRTAKVLREENTQLRDRLAAVEDKLAVAMEEIQSLQYAPSPQSTRMSYSRYTPAAADRLTNRSGSRSPRKQSFLREYETLDDPRPSPIPDHGYTSAAANRPELEPFLDTRRFDRRMSTSSSLFPGPPSNMSMLLHEDGLSPAGLGPGERERERDHSSGFSDRPASPASPTLVLARLSSGPVPGIGQEEKVRHEPGNISPTTADFSTVTSSPGSLNLRPEHELHLEDMPDFELNPEEEVDGLYETGDL